ncbi:3-dehydroquinate synthase [Blautia liquoris]|nr:3-dehydroquinate synthase [Blautia liquoris]
MKSMTVQTNHIKGNGRYDIVWEDSFSELMGQIKKLHLKADKYCIVADSKVARVYLDKVKEILEKEGLYVTTFVFPEGESSKNLQTIQNIYTHLIGEHFDRKDILVALGGGVTGDLTGYAAATYLRGIDFISIPTTLLAQVDSSIGGKTGVDFEQYKNMVGAFYNPRLVYMNLSTLNTLSNRQFACGMGEVLKTGLLGDDDLYIWTINHMYEIEERDHEVVQELIRRCCEIKKHVVEQDPEEEGMRAVLNLGHTIGHAIEKLKDFDLTHGECVALGTVCAAEISHKRGYLSTEEFYEIRDMNVGFNLPITVDGINPNDILEVSRKDKKVEHGLRRFILLKSIGNAVIDDTVTDEEMLEAFEFINGDRIDAE